MKKFILMLIGGVILLSACNKVKTSKPFPGIQSSRVTQLTASQAAWVEQIAKEKADSIRIVDSIQKATSTVDSTSLFNKKNLMIAIVEANNNLVSNVDCFVDTKGKKMFDLTFPFAANLNIDPSTGKAYVSYNPEWQAMIRLGVLKGIQNTGMKVGLSLLGNHDDAGWSNFKTLADATAFAQQVAFEVRQKNFDAVLTDDEYSNYVTGADPNSYVMVMSEIKRLLPDIYLAYYDIGTGSGSYNGKQMGDIADADFAPFYPEDPLYGSLNFPNNKCFASCQDGSGFDFNYTQTLKKSGAGGIMCYAVTGQNPSNYALLALGLKGMTLAVPAMCLNPSQFDFINGQ